jgi:hypothetical protein
MVVQATAPIAVFQIGESREEAVERTRIHLRDVGFRGILKLVESEAGPS